MHRTEGANNVAGLYTAGPPPTTITADALNSIQEEISHVIEQNGIAVETAATDSRSQLYAALLKMVPLYDVVVTSQASWDAIIESTGVANTYKFKDQYKSIYVKNATYLLTLSGGDTWGQLQTNNVKHIEFERNAVLSFGNTQGYLNVNTSGCYCKNITVAGLGTVASAVDYSIYTATFLVTFDNCRVSLRLSNTNMYGFYDASGQILNKYFNCTVGVLTSSGNISGFYNCNNMTNCAAYDLECTGAGILYGFNTCSNINSSVATQLDSANGDSIGFFTCNQVSSSKAYDVDTSGSGQAIGFESCSQVSSCLSSTITSSSVDAYGFNLCQQISACSASGISAGVGVGDIGCGFVGCTQISACYASTISGNVNEGFRGCSYGSSLNTNEAANSLNDYIDTTDAAITNKFSSNGTAWT